MSTQDEDFGTNGNTQTKDEDEGDVVDYSTVPTYRVEYLLEGRTPLLMHAFPPEAVEAILVRGGRPMKDEKAPLNDIASKALYLDPSGQIAVPRSLIFAACKAAGRGVKLQGTTKLSTKETTRLGSFMRFETEWHLVTPSAWRPRLDRGVMNGKVAVGIVRPMFPQWSLKGTLLVFEHGGFDLRKAFQVLDLAGDQCGIGAWRPAKNGEFGTFVVREFSHKRVQIEGRPTFDTVARNLDA